MYKSIVLVNKTFVGQVWTIVNIYFQWQLKNS